MTNTKTRARQLTGSIVANATAKPEKTNAIIARASAALRALNVKEAKITIEGKQREFGIRNQRKALSRLGLRKSQLSQKYQEGYFITVHKLESEHVPLEIFID